MKKPTVDPLQAAMPDLERMIRNRQEAMSGRPRKLSAKQPDHIGNLVEHWHHFDWWTRLAMLSILLAPLVMFWAWR